MLRVSRVAGVSMSPTLRDGDFVLSLSRRCCPPMRAGDVVVVRHIELGIIIKRIASVGADGTLALAGDNPLSRSPETLGTVRPDAVLGRAWLRIARSSGGISRVARRPTAE